MDSEDFLILGAGASGLSLLKLLPNSSLMDQEERVGGHCRSTIEKGYTFDRGPHIMFSKNKWILQIMIDLLGDNVHTCKRNNVVSFQNIIMKYPFENDLNSLPTATKSEILLDFLASRMDVSDKRAKNLEEWFVNNFGKSMTDNYFKPYNEKIWKTDLKELSMSWADRIPSPPWQDVVKSAIGIESEGYTHQLFYQYPLRGGYSAITDALSAGINPDRMQLGTQIEEIEIIEKEEFRITTSSGTFHHKGKLISTIPLDNLVHIIKNCPDELRKLTKKLPVNRLVTVNIGYKTKDENQYTAVYVPDREFLPNRISFPGVFSPHNVPSKDHTLIQSEITMNSSDSTFQSSDDFFVDHVHNGLKNRGFVDSNSNIEFTKVERFRHAYVVYKSDYEITIERVRKILEEKGVIIAGRFGSHNYLNLDGVLIQSIEIAESLGLSKDMEETRSLLLA